MVCYRRVFVVAIFVLWHDKVLKAASHSEPDANQEDDHNWWKGAEEIDLTFHFEETTSVSFEDAFDDFSENFYDLNESCFWNTECDSLSETDIPPDFISSVPPPPIPPFFGELEEYAKRKWKEERILERRTNTQSQQLLYDNKNCSVCDWALGNNTDYIFLTRASESKKPLGEEKLFVLISVGILSALIGAFITAFLVRCKRVKFHRKENGFSFMIISRLKFKNHSGNKKKQNSSPETDKEARTFHRPWPLQLCLSQSSSQAPVDISASNSQANSDEMRPCEDVYSNTEGIYTEIDPVFHSSSVKNGSSYCFSNPYSEGVDSTYQSDVSVRTKLPFKSMGIRNDGYVPSEIDRVYLPMEGVPNSFLSISHYCSSPNKTMEYTKSHDKSPIENHLCQSVSTLDKFTPTIKCNEIALQPLQFLSRPSIHKPNKYCVTKDVFSNSFSPNQAYFPNLFSQTREYEASSDCSCAATFQRPVASSDTYKSVSNDKTQASPVKKLDNEDGECIAKSPLPDLSKCLHSKRNDNMSHS